jgi:hypothetical protein
MIATDSTGVPKESFGMAGETFYSWCINNGKEHLIREWDQEKNKMSPSSVAPTSAKKVWWCCEQGHSYQTGVRFRVRGTECPVCAGKMILPGVNDLASCYPTLAAEWNPTKNGTLTPDMVSCGSHQKVWWRDALGHEWKSQVRVRLNGNDCPVCSGKRILPGFNDLATTHPELADQWHSTKNGSLTAQMVGRGSHKRVWWKCGRGHEWKAVIESRTRGTGCPYCANQKVISGDNDFASFYPRLAAEWHSEKNGALRPDQVTSTSNRAVWWMCPKGHDYRMTVARRVSDGCGCPYCAGRKVLEGFNDLATLEPMVAAEWHPTLNGELKPSQVTRGSSKRVWWQCPFGHSWRAIIYSRTGLKRCGCPVCAGQRRTVVTTRSTQIMEDLARSRMWEAPPDHT